MRTSSLEASCPQNNQGSFAGECSQFISPQSQASRGEVSWCLKLTFQRVKIQGREQKIVGSKCGAFVHLTTGLPAWTQIKKFRWQTVGDKYVSLPV